MKFKFTLTIILVVGYFSYAQQIGDGVATTISNYGFNQPLKSGIYQINSLGINNDESFSWQHMFVLRYSNSANNYQLQFSSSYSENDRLFFRKIANTNLELTYLK